MSVTHSAALPEIRRQRDFGRAAGELFAVFWRKVSSAAHRVATSPRDVPPETFFFPPF